MMQSVALNIPLCPLRFLALTNPGPGMLTACSALFGGSWPGAKRALALSSPGWITGQGLGAGLVQCCSDTSVLMQNSLQTTYLSWTAFPGFRGPLYAVADKKIDSSVSAKPAIGP